jgi:MFS family permease
LNEFGFFATWAFSFLAPFALLWGAILFVFVRLTSYLGASTWVLRSLGAIFAGTLGLFGTAAAGWYIAVASIAVYGGALLGVFFGAAVLPRFATVQTRERRSWWRWAAIATIAVLLLAGIVYPLIPDRDEQSLEVQIMRLVPGPDELTTRNTGLSEAEVGILRSLGLTGKLHGGLQSYVGAGDKAARVLIVVRGPLSAKVTLREPRATSVVYVQEGGHWNMYPPTAPTLRKTITLEGAPGEFEGLSAAIEPVIGKPHPFTWYPPIRTGHP